jgi:hypothetical protein
MVLGVRVMAVVKLIEQLTGGSSHKKASLPLSATTSPSFYEGQLQADPGTMNGADNVCAYLCQQRLRSMLDETARDAIH